MDVICFDMYYAFFHLSWFDNYSFFSLKMNSYILTNQDLLSIDMDSHSVQLICSMIRYAGSSELKNIKDEADSMA